MPAIIVTFSLAVIAAIFCGMMALRVAYRDELMATKTLWTAMLLAMAAHLFAILAGVLLGNVL